MRYTFILVLNTFFKRVRSDMMSVSKAKCSHKFQGGGENKGATM